MILDLYNTVFELVELVELVGGSTGNRAFLSIIMKKETNDFMQDYAILKANDICVK